MMRVYVATGTPNVAAARELKQELRDAGFDITHDWTGTDHIFSPDLDHAGDSAAMRQAAMGDMRGVRTADVVVYLAHETCFGVNIELGMALAYGVPVIVVEPIRGSVFFELDGVQVLDTNAMRSHFGLEVVS